MIKMLARVSLLSVYVPVASIVAVTLWCVSLPLGIIVFLCSLIMLATEDLLDAKMGLWYGTMMIFGGIVVISLSVYYFLIHGKIKFLPE